jgi:hypothetical protein
MKNMAVIHVKNENDKKRGGSNQVRGLFGFSIGSM